MILMLIILVKFFYFYDKVNIQKNYFYTVLYSTLFVSVITLGLNLLSIKTGVALWAIIYYTISIVMLIDVVYFKHFNQLTTVNLLVQIKHLSTVGDSLLVLLDPSMLILILDLIIIPFLPEKAIGFIIGGVDYKVVFFVFIIFFLEILYLNKTRIIKQDIVTYHGADLIGSLGKDAWELKKQVNPEDLNNYIYKTDENDRYFGSLKGSNLIIIQVEALQNFLLERDYKGISIVPSVKRFSEDEHSIYFNNMYQIIGRGNTSDAEFATLTSIIPPRNALAYMEFQSRNYYSIPIQFKNMGYNTMIFHGNEKHYYNRHVIYPQLGFNKYFGKEDYVFKEENKIGFGINDHDFLNQSLDKMLKEEKNGPIFAFIITLSSHTPFNMPEKFSPKIASSHDETNMVGRYINSINYADWALGDFLNKMKETGLMERSTVVLYGDHFAISAANTEDTAAMVDAFDYKFGYSYDDMMNIPLIIHNKNLKRETITNTCSQIDILPTLLNLYGVKESGGVVFGSDIINHPSNFCLPAGYMIEGSFFANDIFVMMDTTGDINEARAFKIGTHAPQDAKQYEELYKELMRKQTISKYALFFNKMTKQ
ncbi:MAG: LTA synthase family protein [Ezakiella sp.]|nr:LTA synthase family protein [Ezakiella sp.]MDD7471337.1 LTA synthase family protein [Bacillota bacterium]MDY3923568.1 LTA synthase family protein [Ezakiella sp.]